MGEIKTNKLTILTLVFLILTSVSCIATAKEIFVQPGNSIQNSINNAAPDDIITVKPGIYTENIKITEDNLTIRSESGNPDDTIINARSKTAHVFLLQADKVKIKGFKISGSILYGYAGICLSSCSDCTIEDNKLSNNSFGIYLLNSKSNIVSRNAVSDNQRGIYLNISENNTLSGNNATNNREYGIASQNSIGSLLSGNLVLKNERGIYFGRSDGNTLAGNTVRNNNVFGLYICGASARNTIYNNYFNNTNMTIKNGTGNAYNITRTASTNIIGGPYTGGNYWAKPDGTGFSQTAVDKDGNGISDSAYTRIAGSKYTDYLPLVIIPEPPEPIAPVANFWGSPRSGDVPLNVTFTDISTETPTEWNWSFGDGTYSTEQNPVHIYPAVGNYTVTLTASNAAGSDIISKNNYITALQEPVANYWGSPRSGDAPLDVTFTDISKGSPTAWNWSFGDGTYSTQQNPEHIYSKAGNYTVTLTASNAAGSDIMAKASYINVTALEKPLANFWGSPRSGNVPLNVIFTDNTTGSPTAWNWSFGDGTYSNEQNPVRIYPAVGNYTVTLTASNAAGSDTMEKNNYITVLQKPVANFWGSPRSGDAPLNVAFTDISKGSPTAWNWSFGDGTYSTQQNPEHIYSASGSYTVKLIASNEAGMGAIIKNNYINITAPQKPITDFWGSPRSENEPLNVTFTDNSTGMPTAWKWSFGDGTYSTVKSPKHMYSAAGNYTVTLTASNKAGSNTKTKTNYINVEKALEKPIANFGGSPRSGNVPLNVTFTNNSTGAPTAWNWSFGDGAYSTVTSPKHTYSAAGNYTVILTVNNKAGNGTITKYNYISATALQKPVANFWGSPRSGSASLSVTFTDNSTGAPTAWNWSFGDGTNSTVKSPKHIYSTAGNFTVKLSVSNKAGTGTMTKNTYIKVAKP